MARKIGAFEREFGGVRGIGLKIDGLDELQRDIKTLRPELKREVPRALGDAVEATVLPVARSLAPRSGEVKPLHLQDSLRVSRAARGARITSRLPYARTVHWGGRHPVFGRSRGKGGRALGRADWTWVYQPPNPFILRAALSRGDALAEDTWRNLRDVFRRNGWTGL